MKGTVRDYKNKEVAFEMTHSRHPYHAKLYRISVLQINLIRKAINAMVENGTLSKYNGSSTWAAPTFDVPKRNDEVQIVIDFHKLNKAIKRNHWPMPTIQDMFHQYGGILYETTLDMIMSYYAMNVCKDMREYLVIINP